MFPCVFALTLRLSVRALSDLEKLRSREQDDKKSNRNSYHIVADLGFAVDDSLLGAYQTVQTRHGGACGRWRSAVNNSRAAQTNKHTGMVVLMVDSCARPSSSFFFPHTTVASVFSVHGWQQSPFFHSAQCEHCEANMTLTLHFLQRPCQSGGFAYGWDSSANTDRLTKLKPPAKQLWIIPATLHRCRSSSHKFLRRPFRFEQMIIF